MRSIAVIGKNFGDEGKGLAVDYFSLGCKRTLVVRHNGGAQSGHTVEINKDGGERFVFHELSSGSFRGADTLWINSFYPDLYKLGEEANSFRAMSGFVPRIFALPDTCVTVPDDVLLNMALESSRGPQRHGSCGMGINECDLRTSSGYGLTIGALCQISDDELSRRLFDIRRAYVPRRLKEIGDSLTDAAGEYIQLLSEDNVLINAARAITENMRYINVLSDASLKELLDRYDTVIFEAGQGLLLDRNNAEFAPHVTASDTGLVNPCAFLGRLGYELDEAVYVTRTYVTRHGAGALPCECPADELGRLLRDRTNEPNLWQGQLRFSKHESLNAFVAPVVKDYSGQCLKNTAVSLFITHLNETNDSVMMNDRPIPIDRFVQLPEIGRIFDKFYLSASRYSDDVRLLSAVKSV